MNIVITMGGIGSRFRRVGYLIPKYMIEVYGKTIFKWAMLSLENFFNEQFIFVVRREDEASKFIEKQCRDLGIKNYNVVLLDYLTKGQAETVVMAAKYWEEQEELFIYNIDTYVEKQQIKLNNICGDGFIPCFNAEGDHWSFVRLDTRGNVVEIREKLRISNNCTIGAYYFKSCLLYKNIYRMLYQEKKYTELGEQYIAPMYNEMIQHRYDVQIGLIDSKYVHVLGTPEEVKAFEQLIVLKKGEK